MVFLFVFFFWDPYDSNVGALNTVLEVSEIVLISFNSFFFFPLWIVTGKHVLYFVLLGWQGPLWCRVQWRALLDKSGLYKSGSFTSEARAPFLLLSVLCPPASGEAALLIFLFKWTLLSSFFWANSSIQSLSRVQLFATPWTVARQASLSITNSWSLPKLTSIERLMPSNHLILCPPLLLLPSSFPSIRVFSNELALHIKWPKYRRFSL